MADSNHVQKLMEGVTAWNQWRSENPDVSIDLRSADLRDAELSKVNLREANLGSCILRDAVLDNADLSSAILSSVTLTGARLHGALLRGANVDSAQFNGADASGANFGEASLRHSNFSGAKLVGANLSKAICRDARFVDAELNRSDLTRTDFRDSRMEKAQFVEASLEAADLRRCVLNEASFKSANLSKADLRRGHLSKADLTNAKLTHTDLRETQGLICDQLTQAQDWEAAYRDEHLACDAAIPDPDAGVNIEVPTALISLAGHPPTVTVTGKSDEAPPVMPVGSRPVETAEEIDEATRQRFEEEPATVVREARRVREATIALRTFLHDLRLNIPEISQAEELLDKQLSGLDTIIAALQSYGDKEAARKTLRDLLRDILESYLTALAEERVTKGILAAAAITLMSLSGVSVGAIIGALVAGPIVGVDAKALKRILGGWREKKDKGE